jgi:hypothetical protein
MVTMAAPLSTPRHDPVPRDALANVERDAGRGRLMVSIGDRCGDALIEAFARVARAYYASG